MSKYHRPSFQEMHLTMQGCALLRIMEKMTYG